MMAADEAGTLGRLKTLRTEVFDPTTAQFNGRICKNTGDGALAEFASAVDAVQCAVEIQRELAARNGALEEDQRTQRYPVHQPCPPQTCGHSYL
jgi:adenylate cyclase